MNQYEQLYNFFVYIVVVPIALGLIRWRWLTRYEKWIVIFLAALLADELLSILCITLHTRNHFLLHLQTITLLCTVAGVYNGRIGSKGLLWKIAAGVSGLMVLEVIFWVGFNHINSITLAVSRFLPVLYALISLNRLFTAKFTQSLTPNPMLYMHLGFFIYGTFSGITACFMSYFIETSVGLYYLFTNMSAMMETVAFGFFSFGFLQIRPIYST